MDINKFIECLNSKNFDTETALSIIHEYCKIYNKDSNKISKLFSILIQNQPLLIQFLQISLPRVISKYGIMTLSDKKRNITFYYI